MALVKADQAALARYTIFDPNRDAVAALQRSVGSKLAVTDLIKITMGINGKWTVPSIAGNQEVDSVEGVVVLNHLWRSLYPKKFSKKEAGAVPQCTSNDGIRGIGDPGVECETCPFNAWGSAGTFFGDGGRGKACKEFWFFYLWREGKRRPELLQVPATSIGAIRQYMMGLLDFAELDGLIITEDGEEVPMPILGVITRFSLQEVKGSVRVVPSVAGLLPEVVWPHMIRTSAFVGSMLAATSRVAEPNTTPRPVVEVQAAPARPDPAPARATANHTPEYHAVAPARPPSTPSRPPRRQVPTPVPALAEDDLEDIEI
jgi:hypothetical protein